MFRRSIWKREDEEEEEEELVKFWWIRRAGSLFRRRRKEEPPLAVAGMLSSYGTQGGAEGERVSSLRGSRVLRAEFFG